jgi:hypothetical protein
METGSGDHLSLTSVGSGGVSVVVKWQPHEAELSDLSSAEVQNRSCIYSSLCLNPFASNEELWAHERYQ